MDCTIDYTNPDSIFQSRYPRILYCNTIKAVIEQLMIYAFNLDILESSIVTNIVVAAKLSKILFQSRYPRILYCNPKSAELIRFKV